MKRLCVFCGSSPGLRPVYAESARQLGQLLAESGIGLVYGGGKVGLMGILADAVLQGGGEVIGVIPESLRALEVAHEGLSDLRVVGSMHERKALMADLSDAFIALPGGIGTFEELLEIFTWVQLGIESAPVGILNVAGFFDPLIAQLDHAVAERFLRPEHRDGLLVDVDASSLLERIATAPIPDALGKWIDR